MPPLKKLTYNRALTYSGINLFATPGLGSLLGRRLIPGIGQLLMAIAGFALLMCWMGEYFYRIVLEQLDKPAPQFSCDWMGKWGAICFCAAWVWSLATSLSMLREAKREEQVEKGRIPPRITEPPPAKPGAST